MKADENAPAQDLNIPDPRKPCVPLPELVAVVCKGCRGSGTTRKIVDDAGLTLLRTVDCELCGGYGSVLVNREHLRVLA